MVVFSFRFRVSVPHKMPISPYVKQQNVHLVPLFADQAAGEKALRIQPSQQVEGKLQRKQAQEVTLQQSLETVGQMAELDGTT